MKSLLILITCCAASLSILAQNITGTVTIKVNGNKNRNVLVDGKSYLSNTNSVNSTVNNNEDIIISDLQPGQHTLEVVRMNNRNKSATNSTSFNLRQKYDLAITVDGNGGVQLKETRIKKTGTAVLPTNTPMTAVAFNTLLQNIKNQTRATARRTAVTDAFDNLNNYFTTAQTKQLLALIASEANRLELAKASYRTITDPGNFSQLYSMFSVGNRTVLSDYVDNYNGNSNTSTGAMTTINFNTLYAAAKAKWPEEQRMSYLSTAFSNTNNHFTTSQAKQLLQLISIESSRVELAKTSFRSITDPANFSQLYDLFGSTTRNELADYVNNYNGSNTNQYKIAMATADFNTLVQSVQKQWQAAGKLSILNNAFSNTNNYFTSYQVRQLLQLVTAETDRLQLAKASYRAVTDPANFSQLYDLFYNQANKTDLAAYITSYNGGSSTATYKTPMTDANFTTLLQDIQQKWLPGAKMSALTSTFANTGNYFTTEQSRQLIQLVSDETNRLQLAKSSYRNLTDPLNYTKLYDVLSTQASRDALAAYVNAYGSTGTQYKTAMADADFNTILKDVQGKWLPGAKMSALVTIFASTDNYFNTAQARQLIQLVSEEANRLQLAKSSYRNIVDPTNFSQLYDLLNSQTSRDDLAAYVGAYAKY